MLKISFSGGYGSGKTSLLNEGKKILGLKAGVESLEDLSKKNPFDTNSTSSFIGKFYCMSKQINDENIKSLSSPDILLCDNSILDHWIRWKKFADGVEKKANLKDKELVLRDIYTFWIKTYDLIFHIRVDSNVIEKRNQKENFTLPQSDELKKIEDLYARSILEDQLNVVEIWNNGSLDESAQNIVKSISDIIQA
jgi:thymidylate kinase